jgi:hypothetical protein
MKTFTSLNGALTLTALAWLSELWRAFLDFAFILPGNAKGYEVAAATVYVILFGIWLVGLRKAQEARWGIIAALGVGLLALLGIDVGTIVFYCPGGCSRAEFNLASWAGLVIGTLAVIALALQLRDAKLAGA